VAAYEVLLLNTAVPQIQAAQAGDTYVVPRDIAFSTVASLAAGTEALPSLVATGDVNTGFWFPAADTIAASTGGTRRLTLDQSGNLGIGTSSPGQKLEVANTSGSVAATLRSSDSGYSELYFADVSDNAAGAISYEHSSNMLRLYNGGSARVYLDSSGNLGLGVVPSAWGSTYKAIQIGTGGSVNGRTNTENQVALSANASHNGTSWTYIASTTATQYQQAAGIHYWFNAPSGTAGNAISFTQAMTLTAAPNLKLGGTAERATTAGTNHLDIFNGTAPVGTLADGISFYSAAGEAYVMDAAGNATLISPHDSETNEWIFRSKHTPTGKVLRIDVERLLRFVNDHFGLDAVKEFVEE
jgi:hypothetical protein